MAASEVLLESWRVRIEVDIWPTTGAVEVRSGDSLPDEPEVDR